MKDADDDSAQAQHYQVGTRLRQLRIQRGLSQRELARRASMTNANLSMIEQGRVSPSIQTLEKILRAVPISLADFFSEGTPGGPKVSPRSEQAYFHHSGVESFVSLSPNASGPSLFVVHQHFKPGSVLTEIPLQANTSWLSAVVVRGTLSLKVGERNWTLACGDAFEFHHHQKFRLENLTDEEATLVLIITSGNLDLDNKV